MPDAPLDTSPEAQETRRKAMAARLTEKGVTRVSELSALFGKPITYDGVAGTICYVDEREARFACDLTDGRRPWGAVAELVAAGDGFSYATPKPEGGA